MLTRSILNLCYGVTALLLLVLALMTLVDVIGRNFLNAPLAGAAEVSELILVGVTFLLYPLVAYRQQHIAVDLFDTFTGPRIRRFQQILAGLLGAVLFALIAYRMWTHADRLVGYGDVTNYLKIPVAYAYYFMSVMSGITTIVFVGTMFGIVEKTRDFSRTVDESDENNNAGPDA